MYVHVCACALRVRVCPCQTHRGYSKKPQIFFLQPQQARTLCTANTHRHTNGYSPPALENKESIWRGREGVTVPLFSEAKCALQASTGRLNLLFLQESASRRLPQPPFKLLCLPPGPKRTPEHLPESHRRLQNASKGKRNNLHHGFHLYLWNGCLGPGVPEGHAFQISHCEGPGTSVCQEPPM